ncbi:MAG: putative esterase [Bacteroidia bacterium]|jgi:predicted esterase
MQTHHISIPKTARVFTLGDLESATEIWIVLHGYGQLASTLIETFESLVSDKCAVIAPEGLHRFYKKGFYGEVVASWMTKEERLNDINDYCAYLDLVYQQFTKSGQKIRIFGFSQGVATACRWVSKSSVRLDSLVLWAGTFPTDISLDASESNLQNVKSYLAYDPDDPFRNEDSWKKQLAFFDEAKITPVIHKFKGGHAIPQEALTEFRTTVLK